MMTHFVSGTARYSRLTLPSLVILAALIAIALSPLAARAQTAPDPIQVTDAPVLASGGPGNQTDPHISGALVAYRAIEDFTSAIRYHDLESGSDTAIPQDAHHFDGLPDVSGTTIVFRRTYTDGSTSTPSIIAFDTANPASGLVRTSPEDDFSDAPAIGGRTIAWVESVGNDTARTNIRAYDLDSGQSSPLSNDADLSNRTPAVSPDGSVIAWAKCEPTSVGCDIYVIQRNTDGTWSTPVQLTDSTGEDRVPDTNGQIVAYTSDAGGDFDIWWKNIDGTGEQQLTMPGRQFRPTISGNLISFESDTVGTTNGDLFVYDLATEQLYQVTNTPDVDETLNDISVAPDGTVRVVWAQPDGLQLGHFDVYAMSFELSNTPTYEICSLFDQSRAHRIKSTVPVKLQLCDTQGQNLSSASVVVTATELVKKDGTASPTIVEDAGNANPDDNFRYDPTLGDTGGYVYNLSTKELSTGTWELRFTVSGDPTTYSVSFDLR